MCFGKCVCETKRNSGRKWFKAGHVANPLYIPKFLHATVYICVVCVHIWIIRFLDFKIVISRSNENGIVNIKSDCDTVRLLKIFIGSISDYYRVEGFWVPFTSSYYLMHLNIKQSFLRRELMVKCRGFSRFLNISLKTRI